MNDTKTETNQKSETNVYESTVTFEDLKLQTKLLQSIYTELKFVKPSKIQAEAIPLLLAYPSNNFIFQAHAGSGKTASYLIPSLQRINLNDLSTQIICLTPTRELSKQVTDIASRLAKFMDKIVIKEVVSVETLQEKKQEIKAHIVIGTPGSILNRLVHRQIFLDKNIKMLILDEADKLLEDAEKKNSLAEQVFKIKSLCQRFNKSLQLVLFSATYSEKIKNFANQWAPNAKKIEIQKEKLSLEGIKHFWLDSKDQEKRYDCLKTLYALCTVSQSIIFVNETKSAINLHQNLTKDGYQVSLLHGSLTDLKERDKIMNDFRTGKTTVLIATNLLSRGIDVVSVNVIVNWDIPLSKNNAIDYETYIHRVGRSGRFARKGIAINFVWNETTKKQLFDIATHFSLPMPEISLELSKLEEVEKLLK